MKNDSQSAKASPRIQQPAPMWLAMAAMAATAVGLFVSSIFVGLGFAAGDSGAFGHPDTIGVFGGVILFPVFVSMVFRNGHPSIPIVQSILCGLFVAYVAFVLERQASPDPAELAMTVGLLWALTAGVTYPMARRRNVHQRRSAGRAI